MLQENGLLEEQLGSCFGRRVVARFWVLQRKNVIQKQFVCHLWVHPRGSFMQFLRHPMFEDYTLHCRNALQIFGLTLIEFVA